MIFFREAYHKLHETETSMDKLGYQLANTIASQIVEQLWASGDKEADNSPEPPSETTMPV